MHLFTIGHSTHPIETFLSLIARHGVTAVADVRSHPSSRRQPQFNRNSLSTALGSAGVAYVFMGRELGARSPDPAHYVEGRVDFARLAASPEFEDGIARLAAGLERHTIALVCAEKEPLECHRTILVCRRLRTFEFPIDHILADGSLESQPSLERRLLDAAGAGEALFSDAALEQAYDRQARRIAYTRRESR